MSDTNNSHGRRSGFGLIVVLFILLVIVGCFCDF
ncbi:YjcZ family sporulation protein [Priestia megaterium]|uniref:YjcZ family sporulation protein n=1 Tax=Priestia megaterium TaxID=1404 RepID=A0A6M6DN32_PRIMG|nr:YjcZ family sporulation protein [Priestia megaterium]QJX74766.1 YjcZ family sporulation protein [Priestia megaterium]